MRAIHPRHDTSKPTAGYYETWYAGIENWRVPGIKVEEKIIEDALKISRDFGVDLGNRVIHGFSFLEWYVEAQNYYICEGTIISEGNRHNHLEKNIANALPSKIISILGKTPEMIIDSAKFCGLPTQDIKLIS